MNIYEMKIEIYINECNKHVHKSFFMLLIRDHKSERLMRSCPLEKEEDNPEYEI